MDYGLMGGVGTSSMMLFAWITYLLIIILLVLGIAALWKYVNKK